MKLLFPSGYKCVCCGAEIDQTKYGLCDKCKNTFPAIADNPFKAEIPCPVGIIA